MRSRREAIAGDPASRVMIVIPVELTSAEVELLLRTVTFPGRVSPEQWWSNSDYFLHFFEAWTSRDLHRVRRLRWRKAWMPFVRLEVRELSTGAEVEVWSTATARRRIALWVSLIAVALWVIALVSSDAGVIAASAIVIAILVGAVIIGDSPRAEVAGVARVLRRLLIRASIEHPATVRPLLLNRMWIK